MRLVLTLWILALAHCAILSNGDMHGKKAEKFVGYCLLVNNINKLTVEHVNRKSIFTTVVEIKLKGNTQDILNFVVASNAINSQRRLKIDDLRKSIGRGIKDEWIDDGDLVSCNYRIDAIDPISSRISIMLVYENLKATSTGKKAVRVIPRFKK